MRGKLAVAIGAVWVGTGMAVFGALAACGIPGSGTPDRGATTTPAPRTGEVISKHVDPAVYKSERYCAQWKGSGNARKCVVWDTKRTLTDDEDYILVVRWSDTGQTQDVDVDKATYDMLGPGGVYTER